ncbi:MAG: globin [Anaerolineae bacterium]|nr:globin [Anaerolineae bacterium]
MSQIKQRFDEGLDTITTLTGLTQADFDKLREAAPQAKQWGDAIVAMFYDTLFDHPRTAAVFQEGERPAREKTLEEWYASLFEVDSVDQFLRNQARIGLLHIRRHVHNEFMIGMANRLRTLFETKAVEAFGNEEGVAVAQAFSRVLDTVVGLTAEGYDVLSKIALSQATGVQETVIDKFIISAVGDVEKELLN